jgi:hypothetical protein
LGILVKGAEFLEKAASLHTVALDKTGTLTTGVMRVVDIDAFGDRTADELLSIAAALEQHSEHPVAQAIRTAAQERRITGPSVATVATLRGFGILGEVNGETYFLGSPRLFRNGDIQLPSSDSERLSARENSANSGATRVLLGTRSRLLGEIRIALSPRLPVVLPLSARINPRHRHRCRRLLIVRPHFAAAERNAQKHKSTKAQRTVKIRMLHSFVRLCFCAFIRLCCHA